MFAPFCQSAGSVRRDGSRRNTRTRGAAGMTSGTLARARRVLDSDGALLLLLLSFTLLVRVMTTQMIETGGDAIREWLYVKLLTFHLAGRFWEWNHHSVRLALIAPAYLVQQIFGTRPLAYYVLPYAMSLLQAAMSLSIGRRLGRPGAGLCAAIAVVMFPQMERLGSQFLPEAFSPAYVMLAVYVLLRYRDAAASRARVAVLLAVTLFLAYLAKITNMFFVPGFAVAMWMFGRRWRDVALCLGVLIALFLFETLLYRVLAGFRLGTLSVIMHGHLDSPKLQPLASSWQIFTRYLQLPLSWRVACFGYLGATALVLATWRSSGKDLIALALLPASFLFLHTFALKSLSPLVPMQRFLPRYLIPALPLMVLCVTLALSRHLADRLPPRAKPPLLRVALVTMLALLVYVAQVRFPGAAAHPYRVLGEYERIANAAFARGEPLVGVDWYRTPLFFVSVLWDGIGTMDSEGKIPDVRTVRSGRKRAWFVMEPRARRKYRGQNDRQVLLKWRGREVIKLHSRPQPGNDMGVNFWLAPGRLTEP